MRKMILALLVVLLTTPAWADVTITLSNDNGVVTIGYDSTAETPLVRAFALDISVTGGTITDVTDFVVGDNNGGYGIFPGNFSRFITVDGQTGEVADWGVAGYTPVADVNDTGAAGALGSNAITIEMGSLYDTQAPGKAGVLCKVVVNGGSQLCVSANAIRGGIVLENAAQANIAGGTACVELVPPICVSDTDKADYQAYLDAGKDPTCWCNAFQCDGDADGATQGFQKYRVGTNDLAILVNNWQKTIANTDPRADFDHKSQGFQKYRVGTIDLGILVNNWQKTDAALPGNCPR